MTQPIHPMLERVARAMCKAKCLDPDFDYDPREVCSHGVKGGGKRWRLFLPDARVVIQALLDPTDDMIEAAHNEPVPNHTTPLEDERICWRAAFRPLIGEGE